MGPIWIQLKLILTETNIPFRELNISITSVTNGPGWFHWILDFVGFHWSTSIIISTRLFLERCLTWVKIILETPTQLTGWKVSAGRTVTSLLSELYDYSQLAEFTLLPRNCWFSGGKKAKTNFGKSCQNIKHHKKMLSPVKELKTRVINCGPFAV